MSSELSFKDISSEEQFSVSTGFITKESYFVLAKIFINFSIFKKVPHKEISQFISCFKSKDLLNNVKPFYCQNHRLNHDREKIKHSILLIGNPKQNLLYGIGEFFNQYRYSIVLNENYHGPNINHLYMYDICSLEEKEENPTENVFIKFSKHEIQNLLNEPVNQEQVIKDIEAIMQQVLFNNKLKLMHQQAVRTAKDENDIETYAKVMADLLTQHLVDNNLIKGM